MKAQGCISAKNKGIPGESHSGMENGRNGQKNREIYDHLIGKVQLRNEQKWEIRNRK